MKLNRIVMFIALAFAVGTIGCADASDDSEPVETSDDTTNEDPGTTKQRAAALESALPNDGDVIKGEFTLQAVIDSEIDVEVRFLLNGAEIGLTNESPYALDMNGCDLSVGNHAYTVEIVDEFGNRDFTEQWFTVEACE